MVRETVEVPIEETVEVEVEVQVTTAPPVMEPIELRIAWWGSESRTTRTIQVIKMFEEEYPYVTMVYEFASWDDHWTRLATQAAGGNLPDIMQHDYARLEEWVGNDLVMPVDAYVDSGVLDFSDVADANLDGGRIDGTLYAVNLGTNSMMFAAEVGAYQNAGVDLPPIDWTWSDLEDICVQIKQNSDIWGHAGISLAFDNLWYALYLSNGEWVYSDDNKSLGYPEEDDRLLVDQFKMILRLYEAGAVETQEEQDARVGATLENSPIALGQAAMQYMWSNQLVAMWAAAGERTFKCLFVPRVAGGQSANYVKPSMFWALTSQAKHPNEGAMFIDYFTNSVAANYVLFAERGVPIAAHVREALLPRLTASQAEMFDFLAQVEQNSIPIPPPDPVAAADLRNNIYFPQVHDPILYGQITPEEGVALLRELGNEVLGASG
jgi:multiple sugar transport system substrate-binding protein